MSAGPLSEYGGVTGVADSGGDSLTEDLNVYYSVRTTKKVSRHPRFGLLTHVSGSLATSHGS
jgi:hypothetical protein